jgi:hypothetical protein
VHPFWSKGATPGSASEWLLPYQAPLGLSGLASYQP